jgi:hypothetical protein
MGTLGYGPPGLFPGFQGFGLGYHLGYGYGGDALGVGSGGGYPMYGGPGYPHPWPKLRRIGRATPFYYYGGPGFPTPDHPNYFGAVGPLVIDQPVISTSGNYNDPSVATSFGIYTGALPYPDSAFAPFTAEASGTTIEMKPATPPAGPAPGVLFSPSSRNDGETAPLVPQAHDLGFEQEPIITHDHEKRMKVTRVDSGTLAQKGGLHAGDIIHSINGYVTEAPGNLPWIIAKAAPDRVLTMTVRNANNTNEHTVVIPVGLAVASGR